jgi:hypothetical protein
VSRVDILYGSIAPFSWRTSSVRMACGHEDFFAGDRYTAVDLFESGLGISADCARIVRMGVGDDPRRASQFIGEPQLIGRGHGTAFIRLFVERLFEAPLEAFVTPATASLAMWPSLIRAENAAI